MCRESKKKKRKSTHQHQETMLQEMYRAQKGTNPDVWTTGMPRQTSMTQSFYPPVDTGFMKTADRTPIPGGSRPRGFPNSREKPYKFFPGTAAIMVTTCPSAEEAYFGNLNDMPSRRASGMVPTLQGIGSVFQLDSCKSEDECRDDMRRIIRNQYKIVGVVGEAKDYEPQIKGDLTVEGPDIITVCRGEVVVLNNGDQTLVTGDTAIFDAPVRPTRFVKEGDEYAQVLQLRKLDAVGYASNWVAHQLAAIGRRNAAMAGMAMQEASGPCGNLEEFQDSGLCFPMSFAAGFLESVIADARSPLRNDLVAALTGGDLKDFRQQWLRHMVSLHKTRSEDETKHEELTKHMYQALCVGSPHPRDRLASQRVSDDQETRAMYTMAYRRQLVGGIDYLVKLGKNLMPNYLVMLQHVEPGNFGLAIFVES